MAPTSAITRGNREQVGWRCQHSRGAEESLPDRREHHSDPKADRDLDQPAAENQGNDGCRARAERHADPQLVRPLCHRVQRHRQETDRRQPQRDERDGADQILREASRPIPESRLTCVRLLI